MKQRRSRVHLPIGDGDVGVARLSSRSVVSAVGGGGVIRFVVEVCRRDLSSRFVVESVVSSGRSSRW